MPGNYISRDIIEKIKQLDLLSYKLKYEPYDLIRCGSSFSLKSHDSLKISNGKWCWHSRGIGGRSALDYLIKVKGMSFLDAAKYLINCALNCPTVNESPHELFSSGEQKRFVLPEKNVNNNRAINYLLSRKIFRSVIDFFIGKGMIYEDAKHHNIVFVGYDRAGCAVHASIRSTGNKRLIYDIEGSDKRYAFSYSAGKEKTVHVFEGAIDALSYITLMELFKKNWKDGNYLSLDGVSGADFSDKNNIKIPKSLEKYLEIHPDIREIILHLDNDFAGQKASEKIKIILQKDYKVVNAVLLEGKDVNEFLIRIFEKIQKKNQELLQKN